MLKNDDPLKLERDLVDGLSALLDRIPIVRLEGVRANVFDGGMREIDAVVDLEVGGAPYHLHCEFKSNGHPKAARNAISQLTHWRFKGPSSPTLFGAPYIPEPTRALCVEAGVNYFDLHGNFRLFMGSLFIEGSTSDKPAVEKRDLKSLFKPKSARVLRWMLRDPLTPRRLKDIAEGAKVSLGQVHNVKEGLLDREWAENTPDGVVLTDADSLVDAWRDAYEAPPATTRSYYTILHGDSLTQRLRDLMARNMDEPILILGGYSAANWIAPYGRDETTTLYAWPEVLPALENALSLEPGAKGANVRVKVLEEESILLDAVEVAPGLLATSPIQTYLDLDAGGERGREAAEFLRHQGFAWPR